MYTSYMVSNSIMGLDVKIESTPMDIRRNIKEDKGKQFLTSLPVRSNVVLLCCFVL